MRTAPIALRTRPLCRTPFLGRTAAGLLLLVLAAHCGSGDPEPSNTAVPPAPPSTQEHESAESATQPASTGTAQPPQEPAASAPKDLPLRDRLPPPARPARGLILISLDTLRADHLGCYGYPRPTSPALDEFARTATRFSNSHSTAPWTLPSHASMLTGLYPFEHGARTCRLDDVALRDRHNNALPLDESFLTLAELLRANRFQTGAFLANESYLDPKFQLDQGFSVYDVKLRTANEVLEAAIPWLRNVSRSDRPFFLFLNLMDTHRPYNCRPRAEFPDHGGPREAGLLVQQLQSRVLGREGAVPPELLQKLVDMYDTAIANLDEELGRFFARLRRFGLFDDVAIVVTADHGEYLGEHDLIEHSKDVYEGALRVPLLVKAPGQTEGGLDERPVSGVHVPALLLQHVRLDKDPTGSGALARYWPPGEPTLAENHDSRLHDLEAPWGDRFRRVRKVIYEGSWKYIESSDGANELYDLGVDPGELQNRLDDQDADRVAKLRAELTRRRSGEVETAELPAELERMSDEERRRLEELGYLPPSGGESGGARRRDRVPQREEG